MKFKKANLKGMITTPVKKNYTSKDVTMVRVTIEFPVLKSNFNMDTIGTHLEMAGADLMYPDDDNAKSSGWISVETSDVTAKDLQAYAKNTELEYLYDPDSDEDVEMKTLK